jgi:hypothetical protein
MHHSSLQALLAHSIDYAGMFPPCSLALEPALKNQADYVRSNEAWMLNTFVLPAAAFSEAEPYIVAGFDPMTPLRISALSPKSAEAAEFRKKIATTLAAVSTIRARHSDRVSVFQLEMFLPAACDSKLLRELDPEIKAATIQAFLETPPAEAERTITSLAEHSSATGSLFGYKLRTGGVTADAFPKSEEIARALVASAKHRVPIKFTAGLHHPVRQFRDEVQAKMYGFLNVLGAAVLAAEHSWDENTTSAMLEDEDPSAFSFDADNFAWREWKISVNAIKARRKLVTSFGSCSFDEPREDLRELKLL